MAKQEHIVIKYVAVVRGVRVSAVAVHYCPSALEKPLRRRRPDEGLTKLAPALASEFDAALFEEAIDAGLHCISFRLPICGLSFDQLLPACAVLAAICRSYLLRQPYIADFQIVASLTWSDLQHSPKKK